MNAIDRAGPRCCAERHCVNSALPPSAAAQRFRKVSRGERLCCNVEPGDHRPLMIWVILDGALGVCASLEDGRRQLIDVELAGGALIAPHCGDGAVFTIEALSEGRICELRLDSEAMIRSPAVQTLMLEFARRRLAQRSAHIAALGRLDGAERMSLFLADVARRVGRRREGALHVTLPLSRDDIADYLGLNAETVSRLLGRIKKSGLAVFTSPTEFAVPDLSALERRTPLKPLDTFPAAGRPDATPPLERSA